MRNIVYTSEITFIFTKVRKYTEGSEAKLKINKFEIFGCGMPDLSVNLVEKNDTAKDLL
jgi:hypothetical protein